MQMEARVRRQPPLDLGVLVRRVCVPGRTLPLPLVADGSQKRPISGAIVDAIVTAPRKLNCKRVLVTHY